MSYWTAVDSRMWGDAKFMQLSGFEPSAKALWVYLLTGPHNTGLPGLFNVRRSGLAECLGWSLESFDAAWSQIEGLGMAEADWPRGTILLRRGIRYGIGRGIPNGPKHLKNWMKTLDGFTEGPLRDEWQKILIAELKRAGKSEWTKDIPEPENREYPIISPIASPIASPMPSSTPTSIDHYKYKYEYKNKNKQGESEGEDFFQQPDPGPTPLSRLRSTLVRYAEDQGDSPDLIARIVDALWAGLEDYYDRRRGSFTQRRQEKLAESLGKMPPPAQILGALIYVDKYAGGHDERYMAGIARRFKQMTEPEIEAEFNRHHASMKGASLVDAEQGEVAG